MDKCIPENLLKGNELKITSQRVLVLNEIINKKKPFSANDLFLSLKNKIDLTTIYRILLIFKNKRLIREVVNKNEIQFYELSCVHNPAHVHFLCNNCGKIFCLDPLPEKALLSIGKIKKDFITDEISINLTGLCSNCSK